MALTLAEVRNLTQDHLSQLVIDELRKDNLLEMMIFDNAAAPMNGGGSSLIYTFNKISTQPTAAVRALNSEYTAQEAKTSPHSVELKILGGAYEIDRVIANNMNGIVDHVKWQTEQKIKAIKRYFAYLFINGDKSANAQQFDGLVKLMASNMINDTAVDISTTALLNSNYGALTDLFRDVEAEMDDTPTAWLCSRAGYAAVQKCADRVPGFYMTKLDNGQEAPTFNGVPFVRLGDYSADGTTTQAIIPTDASKGTTSFYAVRLGMDGVHGVLPTNAENGIVAYTPDMKRPEVMRKGSVEFVTAMVVKNSKSCAAITNVKIA